MLEVSVVIAIISILSVGSLFVLIRPGDTAADWTRLSEAYNRQRLIAVTTRTPMALELTKEAWTTEIWDGGGPDGAWQTSDAPRNWDSDVTSPNAPLPLRVVFLPSGRASGLNLLFTRPDGTVITCAASGWGELLCTGP